MAQITRPGAGKAGNTETIESTRAAGVFIERPATGRELAYSQSADRRRETNRRKSFARALVYGNFRPRRRRSRRDSDAHLYLLDWHEPRILYMALCILLLSCTDAFFTLNLINAGASEANAVMASMLAQGIDVFLAAKIGMTALSLVILAVVARRNFFASFNVEHLLQVFCLGYTLVIYYELYLFRYVFRLDIFGSSF